MLKDFSYDKSEFPIKKAFYLSIRLVRIVNRAIRIAKPNRAAKSLLKMNMDHKSKTSGIANRGGCLWFSRIVISFLSEPWMALGLYTDAKNEYQTY